MRRAIRLPIERPSSTRMADKVRVTLPSERWTTRCRSRRTQNGALAGTRAASGRGGAAGADGRARGPHARGHGCRSPLRVAAATTAPGAVQPPPPASASSVGSRCRRSSPGAGGYDKRAREEGPRTTNGMRVSWSYTLSLLRPRQAVVPEVVPVVRGQDDVRVVERAEPSAAPAIAEAGVVDRDACAGGAEDLIVRPSGRPA